MANLMIFKLLSYRNHNEAKSTIMTDLSFDVRVFESLQYTLYIIQINIRPVLFSPGRQRTKIKRANSNVSNYISLYKHNSAWSNSRQGETICMCRRANITRGGNNFVYSIYVYKRFLFYKLMKQFP